MFRTLTSFFLCAFIFSSFSTLALTTDGSAAPMLREGRILQHLREKSKERALAKLEGGQRLTIAGIKVAVWEPAGLKVPRVSPVPLVIFSHGFHGYNTQSIFLMKALADAGYMVIAPTHHDAITNGASKQEIEFFKYYKWSDSTYKDRKEDIQNLIAGLRNDPEWNAKIDWSKLALAGHSLGGYTVLGLAGAWPSWKLPGVKAVIALAPYTNPFISKKTLDKIDVPVMYQSGSRDTWINPFVISDNGAYGQTPSPAVCVEFDRFNHFAWTNFNKNHEREDLISHYCIEFLDKYVLDRVTANPIQQLAGVNLQSK